MNIRPLGDKLIILRDKPEEMTASGLLEIPEVYQATKRVGTVVRVGPGRVNRVGVTPMSVEAGERVLWSQWMGSPVFGDLIDTAADKHLVYMRDEDLLAVERDGEWIPLHDSVFVRRGKPVERIGLIYVPEVAQVPSYEGQVFAMGPGPWGDDRIRRLNWLEDNVAVGDWVYWNQSGPTREEARRPAVLQHYARKGEEIVVLAMCEIQGVNFDKQGAA